MGRGGLDPRHLPVVNETNVVAGTCALTLFCHTRLLHVLRKKAQNVYPAHWFVKSDQNMEKKKKKKVQKKKQAQIRGDGEARPT